MSHIDSQTPSLGNNFTTGRHYTIKPSDIFKSNRYFRNVRVIASFLHKLEKPGLLSLSRHARQCSKHAVIRSYASVPPFTAACVSASSVFDFELFSIHIHMATSDRGRSKDVSSRRGVPRWHETSSYLQHCFPHCSQYNYSSLPRETSAGSN